VLCLLNNSLNPSLFRVRPTCCMTVEARKRTRPVIISARRQPVAHMSTAVVGRIPSSSSGAAYDSVPRTAPLLLPISRHAAVDGWPLSLSGSRVSEVSSVFVDGCFVTRPKSASYSQTLHAVPLWFCLNIKPTFYFNELHCSGQGL